MAKLELINTNHSRHSQDLIARVCEEKNLGLVVVTEPYSAPMDDRWHASTNAPPTAAIV